MVSYEFKVTYQGNTKTSLVKVIDSQLIISESNKAILNTKLQDVLITKQNESIQITSKSASFQNLEIKGNKNDLEDFYTKTNALLSQNRSDVKRVSVMTKLDENKSVVSSSYDKNNVLRNSNVDPNVDYQKLLKNSVTKNKEKLSNKISEFTKSNDILNMPEEINKKCESIINSNYYSANSNNFLNTKTTNVNLFNGIINKITLFDSDKSRLKHILGSNLNLSKLIKGLALFILVLLIFNVFDIFSFRSNSNIVVNAQELDDDEFASTEIIENKITMNESEKQIHNNNLVGSNINENPNTLNPETETKISNANVSNEDSNEKKISAVDSVKISENSDLNGSNDLNEKSESVDKYIEKNEIFSEEDHKINSLEDMILKTTKEENTESSDNIVEENDKHKVVLDKRYENEIIILNYSLDYRVFCILVSLLYVIVTSKLNGILINTIDITSFFYIQASNKELDNSNLNISESKPFYIRTNVIIDINAFTLLKLFISKNSKENLNVSKESKYFIKINESNANKSLQLIICSRESDCSNIYVIESNSNDLYNKSKITFIHKIKPTDKLSRTKLENIENSLENFYRFSVIESSIKLFDM